MHPERQSRRYSTPASFNMAIIAALPKHATIHGDTIQVLPDITRDFSSDNYLNILRESGDKGPSPPKGDAYNL